MDLQLYLFLKLTGPAHTSSSLNITKEIPLLNNEELFSNFQGNTICNVLKLLLNYEL